MKSLKYTFSIIFLLSLTGCIEKNYIVVENETPEVVITDIDGDGVTNEQEAQDNTDPNDPCDLNLNSQQASAITDQWKALDCDGDGVSNGVELLDGTLLLTMWGVCDYVVEHQDINAVSDFWKSVDCDEDGVSNMQETIDETDLFDRCSLIVENQDSEVPDTWSEFDCDEDGVSNADEIADGKDPLDADSYIGAGTKLLRAFYSGGISEFLNDGSLLDKITNEDNEIILDYTYDSQNRLINVFKKGNTSQGDHNIDFSYNGDQINQITYSFDSETYIYDITYDGLKIHMNQQGITLSNGMNQRTFTFDASGRVLYSEYYRQRGPLFFVYVKTDFSYNGPNNFDLTSTVFESQYYEIATGALSSTEGTDEYAKESYSYSHDDNAKNPTFNASQSVYVQSILMPNIVGYPWYMRYSALSENYVKSASRLTESNAGSTWNNESYGFYFVQPNQYPRFAYRESWGSEYPVEFFYTE